MNEPESISVKQVLLFKFDPYHPSSLFIVPRFRMCIFVPVGHWSAVGPLNNPAMLQALQSRFDPKNGQEEDRRCVDSRSRHYKPNGNHSGSV